MLLQSDGESYFPPSPSVIQVGTPHAEAAWTYDVTDTNYIEVGYT